MKKPILFLFLLCTTVFAFSQSETNEVVVLASIIQINHENFDEITQSELPVILDVNATWCNPCRMMEPIIAELSGEYEGTIQFAKADFDSQKEIVRDLNVTALPTIVFFKPGRKKPVMKHVGFMSKSDFEAKIAEFLKK